MVLWQPPLKSKILLLFSILISIKITYTQGKAQVVAVHDVQETEVEKVKTRAIETEEGSGENKKGMMCVELKMSLLA